MVLKLTPTIRMKPLDLAQVAFYRCKGSGNQSSVFMWTCTMANDLAIEQVNEDANVMLSIPDLHICEIAYYEALCFRLIKLTTQFIRRCRLITGRFVRLKLGNGVRGDEALLLHDSTNTTSRDDESSFLKLGFYFFVYRRLFDCCGISPQ